MNAPTPVNTVSISVGANLAVACQPSSINVSGGPATLSFQISQDAQSAGWQFDTSQELVADEDEYFGIVIYGDDATEFKGARLLSPTEVTFTDADDNSQTCSYLVKLENRFTGQRISSDPSIRNQTMPG
jgi:hypothetical protein